MKVSQPINVEVDLNVEEEAENSVGSPFHLDDELFIDGSACPETERALEQKQERMVNSSLQSRQQKSSIPHGWALIDTAASNSSVPSDKGMTSLIPDRSIVHTNMGTYETSGRGVKPWITVDHLGRYYTFPLRNPSVAPGTDAIIVAYCDVEDMNFHFVTTPEGRFLTDGNVWIPIRRWNGVLLVHFWRKKLRSVCIPTYSLCNFRAPCSIADSYT